MGASPQNVIDVSDLDMSIWRVFKVDYFLDEFRRRTLTLVKPRLWDDPFEHFVQRAKLEMHFGEALDLREYTDNFYGQCWTTSWRETDALWRIYAPHKSGVRIRSTARKIFEAIHEPGAVFPTDLYFIGRVRYVSEESIGALLRDDSVLRRGGVGIARTFLTKRLEFEHEHEVRLLYRARDESHEADLRRFVVEPRSLFDDALFDPRMPEDKYAEHASELRRLGFAGTISQSRLYHVPKFVIPTR